MQQDGVRLGIFVHCPKTAGTSIEAALKHVLLTPGHRDCSVVRTMYTEEIWERAYKFSFVRNPFDRAVATFFYLEKENLKTGDWSMDRIRKRFRNWLYGAGHRDWPWLLNYDFEKMLCEDGQILVDDVFQFESLQMGLDSVCRKLNLLPKPVGWENKSPVRNGVHYREVLQNASDIRRIAEANRWVIKTFGYGY